MNRHPPPPINVLATALTGAGLQMDNQLDIQQDRHQRYLLLEGEDHETHTHEKNVSGISSPIHFMLSCWSLCYR